MRDITLSAEDMALLREYLAEIEELNQREPEKIPAAEWDIIWTQIQATGEIPAEYSDRVGVNQIEDKATGTMQPAYYDLVWEHWNAERVQIDEKYHDAILKALRLALSKEEKQAEQQAIIDLLQQLTESDTPALPSVVVRKLENIDFPIDKVNKNIWHLLENPTYGQMTLALDVSKRGSKKPIEILYSLDFSGLENVSITRKLEPYDKRVYLAIAALYNDGYDVVSAQQIYNAMGYKGRAGATDKRKINNSISKMNSARLLIDNIKEAESYKYDHFKYDGVLLPMERIQAIINGQTVDAAIHIFREPPMVSFARERKQITTIDIKLLDSPLSKTNASIELEDYLIEEIARMKKGSRSSKMLYKTICEKANITTTKQKQRAPGKILQLLEHYKACGFISGYKERKDGVLISF